MTLAGHAPRMNERPGSMPVVGQFSQLSCPCRNRNHPHHHLLYNYHYRSVAVMPRVVPDQRQKFDNDEFFRKHSRESEIKYVAFRDRPIEERQVRFQTDCREGHAEIAFTCTGTNLQLSLKLHQWNSSIGETVDFEREPGKVHLKAAFILNGVCVVCRGWVDLQRLDGTGCIEFDEDRAKIEEAILREQIDAYNKRLREFEERQRHYREEQERQAEAECEARRKFAENSPGATSAGSD